MKKGLKFLMLGAMIVPCAFAFVACGNNSAKVDIGRKSDYQDVEASSAYQELYDLQEGAFDFKGYHFTMKIEANSANGTANMNLNGYVKVADKVELKYDMSSKGSIGGVSKEANMTIYIKDDVLYMQSGKIKTQMPINSNQSSEYTQFVPNIEMLEDIVMSAEDDISVSQKAVVSNIVRYHFKSVVPVETIEGVQEEVSEFWIVLNDGLLQGFKYNGVFNGMKINMDIVAFDGNISFPTFDQSWIDTSSML